MTQTVSQVEREREGELRVVIEPSRGLWPLLRGQTPRERALELFSQLKVWDTERNTGILLYLCLADRSVEILADRGIHQTAGQETWTGICRDMENAFRRGAFSEGVLAGISAIGQVMARHDGAPEPNELPDAPQIL